jgi:hypothetical protein
MPEVLMHYFVKEEEFLERYEVAATVAAWFLKGAWSPNYRCSDAVRLRREASKSAGTLETLVFSGGAVYYGADGFSSVQIALRSSIRSVNVRVKKVNGELVAEKLADKAVVVQSS